MLFTRCPDCDTTFRVTDDALKRANGQVRCGRCASVFNAYAERRDEPAEQVADALAERAVVEMPAKPTPTTPMPATATPATPAPVTATRASPTPTTATLGTATPAPATPMPATPAKGNAGAQQAASETGKSAFPAPEPTSATAAAPPEPAAPNPPIRLVAPSPPEPPALRLEPDADPLGGLSVASVVAQLDEVDAGVDISELGDLDTGQHEAMPPAQVEAVLETEPVGDWRRSLEDSPRRGGWWSAGVALSAVVLALQLINHDRAELVKQPSVGSLVQSAYAALGIVVLPRWDVRQYQILDWVATAEPSSGGIGSLRITARIKNLGPESQPYPDVNLRLKDRWEAAVGGRVFAPAEYLAAAPRKLMAPGETARAQLELVDPGPDAYGFDLDVCVEVETHVLSCRNDKVFL
jgi:predicted Zn finger-like uncharacterized protein